MQEGWKIGEAQHPEASWVIANNDRGISFVVVQPRAQPDRVEIQTSVLIHETHQRLLAEMDQKQRQDLWWRLRFELLRMGVDFEGFEDPVKQLVVLQRMYNDGLTKDRFAQRITKIKNAQVLILWTIQRAFHEPPDDEVLGSGFIQ